jgi:hypothetical protein
MKKITIILSILFLYSCNNSLTKEEIYEQEKEKLAKEWCVVIQMDWDWNTCELEDWEYNICTEMLTTKLIEKPICLD